MTVDYKYVLFTFLFLRNLKREDTSFGSHSSKGSKEHLLHLQPGLAVGLRLLSWGDVDSRLQESGDGIGISRDLLRVNLSENAESDKKAH